MSDIPERLRRVVATHLDVDTARLRPEASFMGDLGADSLDVIELVMAIEDEFGIEMSDEDVETLRTVSDAETYISRRCAP
jgi:acyl carrier protein